MPKRNTESQPIASVLQNMIIGSKLENGLNKVAVESVWHEVMGPPISKYTKSMKWSTSTVYLFEFFGIAGGIALRQGKNNQDVE